MDFRARRLTPNVHPDIRLRVCCISPPPQQPNLLLGLLLHSRHLRKHPPPQQPNLLLGLLLHSRFLRKHPPPHSQTCSWGCFCIPDSCENPTRSQKEPLYLRKRPDRKPEPLNRSMHEPDLGGGVPKKQLLTAFRLVARAWEVCHALHVCETFLQLCPQSPHPRSSSEH